MRIHTHTHTHIHTHTHGHKHTHTHTHIHTHTHGHKHAHTHTHTYPSIHLSIYPSTHLPIYLSIHLLDFNDHVFMIYEKASHKLHALARISPFMNKNKLRVLMKGFIESQFGYCPLIWMFHSI